MRLTLLLAAFMAAACDDGGANGPDGGTDAASGSSCLDPAILSTIDMHVESLRVAAAMLAGHPGEREATGFFLFPELDVQRVAVYAGPLVEVCAAPMSYDEYCEADGLCSQIECTGQGAGWIMHFRLSRAVGDYATATIDVAWLDGATGVTYEAAASAGVWSVAGSGAMDTTTFSTRETYASLVAAGPVEVTAADASDGTHSGSITVAGQEVASVDASGRFVASGPCAAP